MTAPSESYINAFSDMLVKTQGALPEIAIVLAEQICAGLDFDDNGRPSVVINGMPAVGPDGMPVSVPAYVDSFKTTHAAFYGVKAKAESDDGDALPVGFQRPASRADQDAERLKNLLNFGNPWLPGNDRNVTRQAIIAALDPAKASELRAVAGHE